MSRLTLSSLDVGYARGRDRPTLLCIQAGDELKFALAGHRAIEYAGIMDLEERLAAFLEELCRSVISRPVR